MESVCPNCGAKIPLDRQFCGGCGSKLGLPSEPSSKDLSFDEKLTKIQKYLPKGLIEKILSQKDRIEGERRQVTVMFCDMEGFTPLSELLGIEEAYLIMDKVYEILIHKVHDYEGTVNEMTGDGIMALFGAPVALEDAPQRAVRSSLSIHREMSKFSDLLKQEKKDIPPVKMRIGIHTGPVVVGTVGNDLRVEFKAVGDTVNLASRIEGLAVPGTTYVTEEIFKLTEGLFIFEPVGEKQVKGKEAPVKVYQVIASSTRRSRFDVSAERGLTPFSGRQRELELLLDGFEWAKGGRGQAFSIVAEAGVGKSRLLYEFRKIVTSQDVMFLEGRCLSYSRGIAYHPLIDGLKANFDIQEGDGDSEIRAKVKNGLKILGVDEALTLPYFLELLSVKDSGIDKTPMSPEAKKEKFLQANKLITLKGSEIRPLILVYEDLHWIDKSSEDVLKYLLESIPGARVMMIFTYRPEFVHTWGGKSYHSQVPLNRLSNRESLAIAGHLLNTEVIDRSLEDFILEKTEGVPLFIEEFIKSLKDLKIIEKKNDAYYLARDTQDMTIPSTIHDVIMSRVDSLPEGAKEVLQTGSAIEREISYQLMRHVTDLPEQELLSHLSILKDSELLYERGIYPQSTYIFKHALAQVVAYDSLLVRRRQELHQRIGLAFEELYADRLVEQYEVLAYHFSRGEDQLKAIKYLLKAGDKAAGAFANHEAVTFYEQALGIVAEDDQAQRANVLQKLAPVVGWAGDGDAGLRYAESALEIYENLGDARKAMAVHMHLALLYGCLLPPGPVLVSKALKHLEAAATIVEDDSDSVEKGFMYERTAHLYLHRGQPGTAHAWAQKAVDLYARMGMPMRTTLGTALTYTGSIDKGIPYNEKNWEPILMAAKPPFITLLGHELSLTLALVRDVPRAREWGERVFSELTKVAKGAPILESTLRRTLAIIYTLSGEVLKAEEACQAVVSMESKTPIGCVWEDGAFVGFHYLRRGEWDSAKKYLQRALSAFQENGQVAAVAGCSFILGSLNLELGNHAKAEELLLKSLGICQKGGNVIFELWILPVLCELFLKMKQPEKTAGYVDRGFELLKPDQNWYGLPAPIYMAKGMLATQKQDWKTATELFEKAIHINRQYRLPWDEAKTFYELGMMFLGRDREGDRESAREKFDFALEIFERIGARKDVEKVLTKKELPVK
jgi:class 3 adenylate cyclase/tetratricopeptide (TPR) repeat protein